MEHKGPDTGVFDPSESCRPDRRMGFPWDYFIFGLAKILPYKDQAVIRVLGLL